jgi:hypothetical protein
MKLVRDWKNVLFCAWSVRLLLVAAVLSALEVGLPIIREYVMIPPRLFAITSMAVTFMALIARIVAQNNISRYK